MISKFKKSSILWSVTTLLLTTMIACTVLTNPYNNYSDKTKNNSIDITSFSNINHSKSNNTTQSSILTNNTTINTSDENQEISDTEIANLIFNGDASIRKIVNLWDTSNYIYVGNDYYALLKQPCKNYNELQNHLNKALNLNKYFTSNFTNIYLNNFFRLNNDRYYSKFGEFHLPLQKGSIKFKSKTKVGNKLTVTFTSNYSDGTPKSQDTAVLIYSKGRYYIDKMNTWRMFTN